MTDRVSLRLPSDLSAELDSVSRASGRSADWIILRALRQYLDGEGQDILEVTRGRTELASGEYSDFDDVIAEAEQEIHAGDGKAA